MLTSFDFGIELDLTLESDEYLFPRADVEAYEDGRIDLYLTQVDLAACELRECGECSCEGWSALEIVGVVAATVVVAGLVFSAGALVHYELSRPDP